MPRVTCRNCGASFQDNNRHGRHLGGKLECQLFYNNLAGERAQRTTQSSRAAPFNDEQAGNAHSPEHSSIRSQSEPYDQPFFQDEGVYVDQPTSAKRRRVTVEDVEDEDAAGAPWISQPYPGVVAEGLGPAVTHFEDLRSEQEALKQHPYAPFRDAEEWGLVRWLMKRTTQGGVDEFCKLPIVSNIICGIKQLTDTF